MSFFSFQGNILNLKKSTTTFAYPIECVIPLSNFFIVLLDPRSNKKNWGQFPNLFGVDLKGNIQWQAELPTTDTGDSYYKIEMEKELLLAYSTCSYICKININDGKISEKIFIK